MFSTNGVCVLPAWRGGLPPGAAPAVCYHPASEFILPGICDAGLRDPILQMRESRPGESGRAPAAGPGLTQTCGLSAVLLPVKIPPEVRQRGDSFARHGVRCGAPKTSGFWILGPPLPNPQAKGRRGGGLQGNLFIPPPCSPPSATSSQPPQSPGGRSGLSSWPHTCGWRPAKLSPHPPTPHPIPPHPQPPSPSSQPGAALHSSPEVVLAPPSPKEAARGGGQPDGGLMGLRGREMSSVGRADGMNRP